MDSVAYSTLLLSFSFTLAAALLSVSHHVLLSVDIEFFIYVYVFNYFKTAKTLLLGVEFGFGQVIVNYGQK